MKRILSIILSVSVLVSAFSIVPRMLVSANNKSQNNSLKGYYETSDTYLYQSPTTGNWKSWFFIDKDLSSSTASIAAGTDGRITVSDGPLTSLEILDRNNTVKTDLVDFEWQFTFAGIGYVYTNQVDYYMFHVNDDSEYESLSLYDGKDDNAGLSDAKNLFVVARSRRDTNDGLKKDAFTVLQPTFDKNGNSLGLRPVEYTENAGKIIPTENAYINIPGADSDNVNAFATIKITLKGNDLTLSVDPSKKGDGCEYTEKTFTLSEEALNSAPSGDFVVSTSKSHSSSGAKVCHYKNMTVKEIKFISEEGVYEPSTSALLKTPTERKQWLYLDNENSNSSASVVSNTDYDGRNVFFEGPAVSEPLLESNKNNFSTVTSNDVEDFIWSFEYASSGNASYDLISYFMFHVNENSVYPNVKDYNGKGGDSVKAGLDSMSNVFAIAMASDKTSDGLKDYAFTVLQPTKVGDKIVLRPISYTEQEGNIIPDESAYLSFADTDLMNNRSNWSTVNITLEGNLLTLNVQAFSYDSEINLEKTFTLSEESLKYAPSGDFVVTCGNDYKSNESAKAALFKDMTIYNYSYQEYSEGYTFEKSDVSESGRINLQDGSIAVIGKDAAGADKWVVSRGITGKQLTNYSLKYDYTVADRGWTTDAIMLRVQDGANPERAKGYSFVIQGISNKIDGNAQKVSTLSIQKNQTAAIKSLNYDESNATVIQLDKALTIGAEYTVEIEVKGATINVWFYEKGSKKPTKCTLSYTDPSNTYLSGDIGFAARGEGYSVTNITLIDETHGTIFESHVPEVYNSETLDRTDIKANTSGTVTTRNGKVTVISNNLLNDTVYPVKLNNISSKALENFTFEGKFSFKEQGVSSVNFGGYKLSFLKNADSKVVLYKNETQLVAAETVLKGDTEYVLRIVKENGNISAWVSRAGKDFSKEALISFSDTDWLAAGDVWLSTETGSFTFYDISLVEGDASFTTEGFTFRKITTDGRINLHDQRITIVGKKADKKDAWVVSNGVTGKELTDYKIKFDYTVADRGWTVDAFMLRVQDSENPDRTKGYSFVIQGVEHKIDGEKQTVSTLSIQKDSTAAIKTLDYDKDLASVHQLDEMLNIGDEYTIEIAVNKAKVRVWLYPKGKNRPLLPTVTYTDPVASYKSGDFGFAAYSEGYSVTNITLTDDEFGKVMDNYVPSIYNSQALDKKDLKGTALESGTVTLEKGLVSVAATNGLDNIVYPVSTNNLNSKKVEKFTYESNIMFSNLPENEASLNFGGYKLSFTNSDIGENVVLLRDGKKMTSLTYNFIDNVAYCLKVVKNNSNINVWISRVGNDAEEIISIKDTDWLAAGDVWLSTEKGEFLVYNVSLIEGVSVENGVETEGFSIFDGNDLTFEKQSADGIVNFRGERVVLSGLNAESKSSWLVTKGITGKKLSDYTLKYSYIVASNTWTVDGIILRSPDSNSTERSKGYSFVIQGTEHKVDGSAQSVTTLSIQKDNGAYIRSLTYDKSKQSVVQLDAPLVVGTEYIVEAEVKGAKIKVWLYAANETKPSAPTITYTDPEAKYTSGDIAFIARDEGFTVSDISLTDSANGTVCKKWKPAVYNDDIVFNPKELTKVNYETGTVNLSNGKYHFITNNTLYPDTYRVVSNGLFVEKDVYFGDFELCFELEFNQESNNELNIHFAKRDYSTDEYNLSIDVDGSVVLYRCGKELAKTNVPFLNNVRYQVLLSNKDGVMKVYIYRLSDAKPKNPNITVKDSSPLSSGILNISTEKGDFYLSKIGVRSFDKTSVKGPTGTIFAKDFEGDNYNLDGLEVTINNTEHTTLNRDADGNGYLRIVGMPYEADQAHLITGVNARSQVKFGSNELYNFDLSAKIRFKSAFTPNWSYITVGAHANPLALRNEAIWMNVGPRGSTVVHIDTENNLTSNNVVATNGMVKGTAQSSYMPNDSQEKGMPFDGYWHDLKVSVRENTYSIYVDGEFMLSYTDPDNTYEKGSVYLYGYGINYDLDDILLTNNSEQGNVKEIDNTVYENADGFKLKQNEKSKKLLGKNLTEFEWEFEYKAGDSNWGRTAFLYRVNNKSSVKNASTAYNDMQNVFGFVITGTHISSKTNKPITSSGIYNNGITVFAPNTDVSSNGNILPVLYTQETDDKGVAIGPIVPTYTDSSSTRSAIDFSEIINEQTGKVTTESIDVAKWMTVNVRLVGNKLYISVWQTGNKSKTLRRQNFVIPMDAVNNFTAGDFMVVNGDNSAAIRNIKIRDMSLLSVKRK